MRSEAASIRELYSEHEKTLKLIDEKIKIYQHDNFYKEYKELLEIRFETLQFMQTLITNYPYWIDEG